MTEIEGLPSLEFSGPGIPRQVVVAIQDNELIGASGEYGPPEIGEPIQYDELRIEHRSGIDQIIVYNHAIMLLKSADEIYPRIWRVLFQIGRVDPTRA